MSDDPAGAAHETPPHREPRFARTVWDPQAQRLDAPECLRLISAGGVGRLAYAGVLGLAVLPVSYRVEKGSILFRTPLDSPTDEDLRTGIEGADFKVSFEIDNVGQDAAEGWFVFIQGAAHHIDSDDDRASGWLPDVQARAASTREHFVRITPSLITGRRLRRGDTSA
jgi:hypothetical protein